MTGWLTCRTAWLLNGGQWMEVGDPVLVPVENIAYLQRQAAGVTCVALKSQGPMVYASGDPDAVARRLVEPDEAPVACLHPESARIDFSGMSAGEEWECARHRGGCGGHFYAEHPLERIEQ